MASQLHDAVQLAQAGERQEARRLLWQVVQSEPNNEIAWLWLASVAADLPEYERALTEVLRVNPGNQQARQLLAQFREQYGVAPAAQAPAPSPYTPQPSPQTPPPGYYPPAQPQPPAAYGYPAAPGPYAPEYPPPAPAPQPAPAARGSRFPGCLLPMGCGCGGGCLRGCLLTLFLFVILPAALCGGLSYARFSLGPADLLLEYLPGDFGRKDVDFTVEAPSASGLETGRYAVEVTVPRSWFPAVAQNQWWVVGRDLLDDFVTLDEANASWQDLEIDLDASPSPPVHIVEMNPFRLASGGYPILLTLTDVSSANTACSAVEGGLPSGDAALVRRGALCGVRADMTEPAGGRVFQDFDGPNDVRVISFSVPVDDSRAANWQLELPADLYATFEDDIARIVESAEVVAR